MFCLCGLFVHSLRPSGQIWPDGGTRKQWESIYQRRAELTFPPCTRTAASPFPRILGNGEDSKAMTYRAYDARVCARYDRESSLGHQHKQPA
jgi:hypothetical protein